MRIIKNTADVKGVQYGEDIIYDVAWPDPPETDEDIKTFDVRYDQAKRQRDLLHAAVERELENTSNSEDNNGDNGNNGNNGGNNNGRASARDA